MKFRKNINFQDLVLIGFVSVFAVGAPQAKELRTSGIYKLDCRSGDFAWGDDDGLPMNVKAIDRYGTSMMLESTKGYNEWWRVCRGVAEKRKLQSAEGQGARPGWMPIARLKKALTI